MDALINFTHKINDYNFPIVLFLFESMVFLGFVGAVVIFIYDRYIQRDNQLLINYPLIGRLRYIFYALRDPMRQYFGDEKFYDSFDKVKWVYNAAEGRSVYASFAPSQMPRHQKYRFKNANCVLNLDEVTRNFQVTFGTKERSHTTSSVIGRSAMSDGAISPEATRAFSKGAYLGHFPINTGEGGLTSNFLYTHQFQEQDRAYMDVKEGTLFAKGVYRIVKFLLNSAIAEKVYRDMVIRSAAADSYLFDKKSLVCFRINFDAPLEVFPKEVPDDIADIVFQMGSGLYGVRNNDGDFCPQRYQKTMRFCSMTEIKIAQGAKQTGGKLLASKVSESIAYFRGVKAHVDLISPNKFPYANTLEELFDFIATLKQLSNKPVGIKIVLSSKEAFLEYVQLIQKRIRNQEEGYPDFITIDGADGGSGAAPLDMMLRVGMDIEEALEIADTLLQEYGVREHVKIIASQKVLTPDDALVLFALGADFVAIARAFMLSAGCIRARECSGANGRSCPVGLATQNKKKRASFLVEQKARHIASYHAQLLYSMRELLAIMGVSKLQEIDKTYLTTH